MNACQDSGEMIPTAKSAFVKWKNIYIKPACLVLELDQTALPWKDGTTRRQNTNNDAVKNRYEPDWAGRFALSQIKEKADIVA